MGLIDDPKVQAALKNLRVSENPQAALAYFSGSSDALIAVSNELAQIPSELATERECALLLLVTAMLEANTFALDMVKD